MKKTYKYRIYPNQEQKKKISTILETCRILYNNLLAERKELWEKEQKKLSLFDQIRTLPTRKETNPFLKEVYSQVLQGVVKRIHESFKGFFRRLRNKKIKAGYPRFRQYGRYDSFTYPQYKNKEGFWVKSKQIKLPNLDWINIRKHREIQGTIKTCSIIVKNNKYYVCFVCEVQPKPLSKTNKNIGIDLGLTSFIATSDNTLIKTPNFYREAEQSLSKADRRVSRRILKSKRKQKAKLLLSKQYEKVSNQRKNFAHKLSRELVGKYDLIAHEKLQINNLVKNKHLSKSINDAGWNLFLTILSYKAEEAGKEIVSVDPRNTSQTCSNCGELRKEKLKLSQRKFKCSHCEYKDNRDINAAKNILFRAEGLGTSLQGAVS